eukprot:NODE_7000_length_593_cov_6.724265_g6003_i0.p2 GENE.NODE_7000_length_593_cov_6.724265_g6003_i0~~NODE_7000_length_593_cov_6.724265_g6003_i0.p2  ORF type:complete len:85 (+),score=1.53 NODE_7000_length_593_cov_6.724265_g6003_i0:235-489(+)
MGSSRYGSRPVSGGLQKAQMGRLDARATRLRCALSGQGPDWPLFRQGTPQPGGDGHQDGLDTLYERVQKLLRASLAGGLRRALL